MPPCPIGFQIGHNGPAAEVFHSASPWRSQDAQPTAEPRREFQCRIKTAKPYEHVVKEDEVERT